MSTKKHFYARLADAVDADPIQRVAQRGSVPDGRSRPGSGSRPSMASDRQENLRWARMGLLRNPGLWRLDGQPYPQKLAHERALKRANEGVRGIWRLRQNLAEAAVVNEELHEYLVGELERWLAWQGPNLRQGLDELEAELSRRPERRRIAALRETAGRTPQEITAYQAKAAELEHRLRRSRP